jgi:hypothetical protein
MARSNTTPIFPHKPNPDGSIDSICPDCFRTVGSSTEESELSTFEAAHICLGFGLARLLNPMESRAPRAGLCFTQEL